MPPHSLKTRHSIFRKNSQIFAVASAGLSAPAAACQFLREQVEFMAASRPFAPDEPDLAMIVRNKRPRDKTCASQKAGLHRERGQQRRAKPIVRHLYQSGQARRFHPLGAAPARQTACGKRMLTQAVTVLQEQQVFTCKLLRRDAGFIQKGMALGERDKKGVLEKDRRFNRSAIARERQQHHVELALMQVFDQTRG